MSDIIKLLPANIANQIAAGEVIQRPASVVKELMENAIDAGAMTIDVKIKDAGKTLIQVVDNGNGMSPSDALICFQRHATSKVSTAKDLFSLTTKGFRGEALASIAAIAHVEMKTRTASNDLGQVILIEGSEVKRKEDVVCPIGTSFEVKNLFYNVPARRNFLKRESTEFRHIQDEFERIALAHQDLHLTLTHNESETYNLYPAVLRKRLVNIFGGNSNDRLVPIEESTEIVSLRGFILKPEYGRKTRGDQFLFVNNRFFKSPFFNHAVVKAFEGLLKQGAYPGYFLYLSVDTEKIDVNVHPTKTEIKFEEEKFVYSIILSSIKQALGKYNIAPTLEFEQETSFDIPHAMKSKPTTEPMINIDKGFNPFKTSSRNNSVNSGSGKTKDNITKGIEKEGFGLVNTSSYDWENFYKIEEESDNIKEAYSTINMDDTMENVSTFIVKGSYIITPSKSGLMMIHARRAIEQIVYSKIHKLFIMKPIESQKLLFPFEREVSINEITLWDENTSILKQLGYHGEIKDNLLKVNSVPAIIQEESISNSLDDIFQGIGFKELEKGDIAHTIVLAIAKSAAMKKINLNTNESIQALINQLFQCDNHTYSPRKKKIIETISLDEIQYKFK